MEGINKYRAERKKSIHNKQNLIYGIRFSDHVVLVSRVRVIRVTGARRTYFTIKLFYSLIQNDLIT